MPRKPILITDAVGASVIAPVARDHRAETPRQSAPTTGTPRPGASPDGVRLARVRLSTSVELQVAERGRADGAPVLLLHGYTDSWASYARVLEGLPAHVRAIVPTQRGHGDSERPTCCYRIADFAADAVALLDALGVERAAVVGHSMGSFVAQRVAIDHPDRVTRLVLIGSGPTARVPSVTAFNDEVQRLTDPVPPPFVRDFQVSASSALVPPAFLDVMVRESRKLPARVWRDVLTGLLAADAKDELHRIRASTLVLWGDRDPFWMRPEQDALVRAIPGARLIVYQGIGHAPLWEQPARVVADLTSFLGVSAPAAAADAPARR